jgi:hypothetical protein
MSDFRDDVIDLTGHRPWPLPTAPWVMSQTWHDVLFAHWPVATSIVRTLVPSPFAVHEFEGLAWISVVAFGITNLGVRGLPALPGLSSMAELNVRSYVDAGGRPGVYFFSLDASNELLAHGGPGDLSLFRTLEGLAVGVQGKRCLWRTLQNLPALSTGRGMNFAELGAMAVRQWDAIEKHRRALMVRTFSASSSRPGEALTLGLRSG